MRWLALSFVTFIFGFFNFFAPIRGFFQYLFAPVQFGLQEVSTGVSDWFNFYAKLQNIHSENLRLLTQTSELEAKLLNLSQVESENVLLKEQLGIMTIDDVDKGLILAEVFGNALDKTGTSLYLNKGSIYGVSVDDIVIRGKYLIGIVREVSTHRSKVELITSPTLAASVVEEKTATEGLSQGQFGTSVLVNRILPEDIVLVGDIFTTSGRDGVFPPGYILGKVIEVSTESPEVLKTVTLSTLVDLQNLDKVFVLPSK